MTVFISLAVLCATSVQPSEFVYDDIAEVAINNCPNKQPEDINMQIVNDLIVIENEYFKRYNIPNELRGMVLAAACHESGFNPVALGDWTPDRQRARAVGILQLWPWWENPKSGYGYS